MNQSAKSALLAAGAEATRQSLLFAALRQFGEKGYDAASTRALAAEANSNVGSIAYHFGGKIGLYWACGDYIIDRVQTLIGASLAVLKEPRAMPAGMARQLLIMLVQRFAMFLLTEDDAKLIAPFMLRELAHPGDVFEKIYATAMAPAHQRLCEVWEAATGEKAENPQTILTLFAVIGQILYFRIAATAVRKRLGWSEIDAAEANAIVAAVTAIVEARLNSRPEYEEGNVTP